MLSHKQQSNMVLCNNFFVRPYLCAFYLDICPRPPKQTFYSCPFNNWNLISRLRCLVVKVGLVNCNQATDNVHIPPLARRCRMGGGLVAMETLGVALVSKHVAGNSTHLPQKAVIIITLHFVKQHRATHTQTCTSSCHFPPTLLAASDRAHVLHCTERNASG